MPIDVRPRLLYNPDLESSHFFVPGLIGIILQLVTLFLTSFAVVRERELGTLEQLFVTPVGRTGLLLGKLLPYAIVGFVELLMVVCVMVYVFRVPIHGSVPLLLSLAMLFMVCSLSLGLLVSTLAHTQLEAMQFAFVIMLPSVLLSGFVFPRPRCPCRSTSSRSGSRRRTSSRSSAASCCAARTSSICCPGSPDSSCAASSSCRSA